MNENGHEHEAMATDLSALPYWRCAFAIMAGVGPAEWYHVSVQAPEEASAVRGLLGSDWVKGVHELSGEERYFAVGAAVAVVVKRLEGDALAEHLAAKAGAES